MLNIAICDDEQDFAFTLKEKVISFMNNQKEKTNVSVFTSSKDLLLAMNAQIRLYLLDIDMPVMSGIETALILRKEFKQAVIIFISHDTNAVFDTFQVSPLRFVRKHLLETDLADALKAFYNQYSLINQDHLIPFTIGKKEEISISMKDISYLSSEKHYVIVHYQRKTVSVREKLDYYDHLLSPHFFVRIGKSFLINLFYVDRLLPRDILLKTGEQFPISRNYIEDVRGKYMDYIRAIS